jgi:hypothetical protein
LGVNRTNDEARTTRVPGLQEVLAVQLRLRQ